eukprot:scaffold184620_cov33-Tisochrysis_lutea.AAC.2
MQQMHRYVSGLRSRAPWMDERCAYRHRWVPSYGFWPRQRHGELSTSLGTSRNRLSRCYSPFARVRCGRATWTSLLLGARHPALLDEQQGAVHSKAREQEQGSRPSDACVRDMSPCIWS